MKKNSINLKAALQNDNVFVTSKIASLSELTGLPTGKGLEKVIVSEGQIVNVVSDKYGHLPNERFFYEMENQLIDTDIQYVTRSINRENRSFAVDYILSDDSYHINIKNGLDKLRPMIRLTNSYDSSCRTSGHFGFFREVCSNGLHVAHAEIGFSSKHCGDVVEIVLPEIATLVQKFMDNEYYSLHKKFEVLAETPIKNLKNFVRLTATKLNLFQYESSEKNPDPSLNARIVIDTIKKEANLLGQKPSLWLGYNAFNELLHGKLKKNFDKQKELDEKLFNTLLQAAN